MLQDILGWFVILIGIWWAVQPTALRGAMTRKTSWQMFLLSAWLILLPLLTMGKKLGLVGGILILVLFWIVFSRLHDGIRTAFGKVPLIYFQAIGAANIIGGILMLRY